MKIYTCRRCGQTFEDYEGEGPNPTHYYILAADGTPTDKECGGRGIVYATDREETEPCERNTPGCSILHGSDNTECETW